MLDKKELEKLYPSYFTTGLGFPPGNILEHLKAGQTITIQATINPKWQQNWLQRLFRVKEKPIQIIVTVSNVTIKGPEKLISTARIAIK